MEKKEVKPCENYQGVNIDIADDEKVNEHLVEQETKELNNNPRNNDL